MSLNRQQQQQRQLSSSPVSFYLGNSSHSIGSSDSLSSIDDNDDSGHSDYYSTVDADYHFGDTNWLKTPFRIRPCLSQLIHSATTPNTPKRASSTSSEQSASDQLSLTSTLVDYMCDSKSIVAASRSNDDASSDRLNPFNNPLVPCPNNSSSRPFSPYSTKFIENIEFDLDSSNNNSYTTLNDAAIDWISPQPFYRLTAKAPTDNKTIPINLDPVSPLLLAAAVTDSSESLVGLERKAVEELNLELHPYICDKFHQRPLLADPELPFIPSEPVFPNVDELFEEYYPQLTPGSVEHIYHKERLLRNRLKLKQLSRTMNQHEDERRRLLSLARLNGLETQPRSRVKLY